jgi:hypothetical protein
VSSEAGEGTGSVGPSTLPEAADRRRDPMGAGNQIVPFVSDCQLRRTTSGLRFRCEDAGDLSPT